ncbi:MAG: hypothetical protein CMC82_06890 [Flavobacteriaceae bacterium]|nr:hypothetical protein [Flavobacteriaceae bacterium]
MFEKSISRIESGFILTWFLICGTYWIMIFKEDWERIFEYDIYVSIISFLISIGLGYKKITADARGITKSPYLIPSMKKTKTWSEIKHMAHVSSWSRGKFGVICYNILCFIDFDDKICFKIEDETRSSKYNKKTQSIETKIIKPSLDFSNFIYHVKRKEDTYETELIMKNTWLGKKVDYEKYKDPKIIKGFF